MIGYQGDGDLSAIGSAEILHAANRGENITVIFVNNAIYSMTGGQSAPTTLLGQKSTTTPNGRNAAERRLSAARERTAGHAGGAGLHRARGPGRQQADCAGHARDSARRGEPGARAGLLADRSALAVPDHLEDVAGGVAALGARRDGEDISAGRLLRPHQGGAAAGRCLQRRRRSKRFRTFLASTRRTLPEGDARSDRAQDADVDLHVRVAGFGGQGVLLLGEVLAEAGLDAGLEVSWLPSYGPEMRSGTSNCHVRLSREPIDSPLVTAPNVLVAMNEPSLRKFDTSVRPGGWVIYNGETFPEDCAREDVHVLALPFTQIADELGDARACQHGDAGRAA